MALKFRRGTTAQQSGSLAFGEPYVNTTLGTLLIGGPDGDILLSATGTGSTGNFGPISGSGLDITGDANIHGNLTLGGNITIGDSSTDNVSINADLSSSIIPDVTNAFDLGSTDKVYRNVYATSISGAIAATNGVVSGSSQVIGILDSLNSFSGSQLTQNSALATITGSLIASASTAKTTNDSQGVSLTNLNTFSGSTLTRLSTLETETSNLESFTSSINTTIKSKLNADGVISGSSQILGGSGLVSGSSQITLSSTTGFSTYSTSVDTRITTEKGRVDAILSAADADKDSFAEIVTLINSVDTTNDNAFASFYTASVGRLNNLESTSGSVNISVSNLNTFSGSALTRLSALEVETANLESFTSSINTTIKSKLDADGVISGSSQILGTDSADLIEISGSLVTNQKATFGYQFGTALEVTGGVEINNGISYPVQITDNFIVSGSTILGTDSADLIEISGSLVTNQKATFGYQYGTALEVTGGVEINNGVSYPVVIKDDLVVSGSISGSNIVATTGIYGNIYATNGIVSGSSQITYESISSIPSGIVSGSSQITISDTTGFSTYSTSVDSRISTEKGRVDAILSAADADKDSFAEIVTLINSVDTTNDSAFASFYTASVGRLNNLESTSASVNISVSNLNTYTGSNNTTNSTQNSRLDQLSTASGSAITRLTALEVETANLETFSSSALTRLDNLEGKDFNITLTGDVTGTGTVTNLGNVSFATTIAANSVALGTDTTGNYVASLVAGTNITLSNNSGENATPTIGLTNNAITIAGVSTALGGTISAATIGNAIGAFSGSSQINVASTTGDIALGTRTSGNYVATMTAGTGITVGTATGEGSTPIITNTGVTSNVAGTGVTVSGATGAVTISIGQAVATSSNVQFNSLGVGMAASATVGRIDATNDIVAFSSSDIRFKENIQPIENALEKISKISGNTYDWKAENKIEHGYEGNDVGVIAQEIEAVLPQLVQTRENGFKAVKYDKLVALLIEGIKEQQLQIEQLRIDLDNCRNKGL